MLASEDYPITQFTPTPVTVQVPQELISQISQNAEIIIEKPEDGDLTPYVIKHLQEALSCLQRIDQKHEVIFNPRNHPEKVTKKLIRLINGLKLLQLHCDFLLEVVTAPSDEELPRIVKKFNAINRHYKPITRKIDISLHSLGEAFEKVIHNFLKEVEKATDKFFVHKEDGTVEVKNDKKTLHHVQILGSKLETTLEYFPGSVTFAPEDVFAHPKTSETWKELYKNCEIVNCGDKETVKKRYKPVNYIFKLANAMLYKSEKKPDKNSFKDSLKVMVSGLSYGTKTEKAALKASLYLSDPNMESAFQVWNFLEKGWVQDMVGLTLPTIDYDKKVYIHRLFPSINRETILKEYEEGTSNKITENTFKPIDLSAKKDLILESIFKKQADAVKMRVISPFPLVLKGINSEKARAMAMKTLNTVNSLLTRKSQDDEPDGIIFHIHGGGFVSGSSSSHRPYLYRWAKNLKKIIVSVDYRLAPDYPYPAGLDDIWQAYNWVVNYAEPLLGIKTNKIVLAGDSAGGNLVMALTLRAIKMGVRVPDGCLLAYPALNLDPQRCVPSYFLALEDSVLPYSLLKLCVKAYVTEEFKPGMDPFLSPVDAEDHLLEKLPPIRILTGTDDPLHDDNWKFLQKMQKLEKDIKMTIYEHIPHGYFSFDQIEGYKTLLEGACKTLSDLFGETEREPLSPLNLNAEQGPSESTQTESKTDQDQRNRSNSRQIFRGILDRVFRSNTTELVQQPAEPAVVQQANELVVVEQPENEAPAEDLLKGDP